MSPTSNAKWQLAASMSDNASAQMMAELFRAEGVPAEVVSITPLFLGELGVFEVRVPTDLLHRARWLMSQTPLNDAELTFLATGELGNNDNTEQ